jgi:glycogen debranching enzyme
MEGGMAMASRRMPELWRGDDREPGRPPTDYASSCTPQAWSAASAFSLISTLLGLQADAKRGQLRVTPIETKLWRRVEVSGLHFNGARIDFSVDGTEVKVGKVPKGITVRPA